MRRGCQVQCQCCLIAIIGDEDTCVGFLLGCIGEVNKSLESNFMVVLRDTTAEEIEACFKRFVGRSDIGIILINQIYADMIRKTIDAHTMAIPTVLEIPSKQHPYDPSKDSILKLVNGIFKSPARKK
ncbi:V-type proton ATPase subunit F-like [Drosophila willistoni]|uniref:V-type proton ATPase subunit F-like n=1 Tax=Drosophila willistoni TaxID=7260 RepID=UPI000C26D355|nr:V-type proton ATPase subunit F-like [Drosophila willistoni]